MRGDPNAPRDEVASLYQLSEVECSDEERSLLAAIHRSNP